MGLDIDGLATVVSGTGDPTVAPGHPAPPGSLYLRTNGEHWRKTGASDLLWANITLITLTPGVLAAGTTQNYAPVGAPPGPTIIRQAVDALGSALGGLVPVGGDGRIICLENISVNVAQTLTLVHVDAGSAAANQIICPTGLDVIIPDRGVAILIYDGTATSWRVVSVT